jgi:hypothetical protein
LSSDLAAVLGDGRQDVERQFTLPCHHIHAVVQELQLDAKLLALGEGLRPVQHRPEDTVEGTEHNDVTCL